MVLSIRKSKKINLGKVEREIYSPYIPVLETPKVSDAREDEYGWRVLSGITGMSCRFCVFKETKEACRKCMSTYENQSYYVKKK